MPRILLVEDNPSNLDMLSRRLAKKGFEVLTATDGAQGVAVAVDRAPELILMDMSLPVMDGWAATRALREIDSTRTTPIIALTAHALAADRAQALDAGCTEYATKPIDFAALLDTICRLLENDNAT
jgi:two-component system cell cycle response regulator DivK